MSTIAVFKASPNLAGAYHETQGLTGPEISIARAEIAVGWFTTRIRMFSPQGTWIGTRHQVHRSFTLGVAAVVAWGLWKIFS